MPTTIDSAGIIFNDASTITSANTFIAKPASPSNGQVLGYNGSTWTGTSLSASPTSAKAWVNFNGAFSASVFNLANGDILTPNNGLNTVNWFNASGPWTASLGVIYKFQTIGGSSSGTLGGVPCSQLYLQLVSSIGNNATLKLVNFNGTNTSTVFSSGSTLTGNGTSSVATFISTGIRSSYNVSSVTKLGTGRYIVNFPIGVFADANYSAVYGSTYNTSAEGWIVNQDDRLGTKSATQLYLGTGTTGLYADSSSVYVAVFGN